MRADGADYGAPAGAADARSDGDNLRRLDTLRYYSADMACRVQIDGSRLGFFETGWLEGRRAQRHMYEVSWEAEEIVVMKTVRISPPYSPDCVTGDAAASNHVRKIVEKHLKDREEATRQAVGAK